ncbi:hypothetical protein [Anaeroselena agilis]|uniref:Uncharacterized protein n=1 Tax=Anaeroselena agilis TaxID=3063788 RepID=A0ABU3NXP6_9FIRM|nr:hypothetical protein [Selenomonadales bacterium 4137-cl]
MKVENLELISWTSGLTSAGLNSIQSYKLYLNGKLASRNIPYVEFENELLQIDVCEECFTVGCSSGGYVQILKSGDTVIWKQPLVTARSRLITGAYILNYGSIYWPAERFYSFLEVFRCNEKKLSEGITPMQGIDLWAIHGNKSMKTGVGLNYPLERLEENFLVVYSDVFSNEESFDVYKRARKRLGSYKQCNLIEIPHKAININVMFDIDGCGIWDCLYIMDEEIVYSIGDGYGLVFV